MMVLFFWLLNAATVIVVYLYWIRPLLLKNAKFSALVNSWEGSYFSAFSAKFAGIKQKLTAALVYLAGMVVMMHDWIAPYVTGVDVTPIIGEIQAKMPSWGWPVLLVAITALLDYFRSLADKRA
jgi:hypothetical protein